MNSKLSGPELVKLKNLAVACFSSSDWRELGALTNTFDEVENHPRFLNSLDFGDPDYDGLAIIFLNKMIDGSDENLATVQDFILKKSAGSGEYISSEQSEGRKIVFSPNVFDVPSAGVDPNLVSVMMPFDPFLLPVFDAVKSAANDCSLTCNRADDIWDDSTVIQDIFSLIFKSFIVVCDFSRKNPNVFYEAGIAHALGKHVVPITDSNLDIPFDLRHHRYIKYLDNTGGLVKLRKELVSRFSTLTSKRNPT